MFLGFAVAIFALFSQTCFAQVPSECKPLKNAVTLNIKQLDGTIWYVQRFLNAGGRYEMTCGRTEYVSRMDNQSLFQAVDYLNKSTGNFNTFYLELKQSTEDSFFVQVLKDKSKQVYVHIAKNGDNLLIESMCFTIDGKYAYQIFIFWTKERVVKPEIINEAVANSGVTIENDFTVVQNEDCFKNKTKN